MGKDTNILDPLNIYRVKMKDEDFQRIREFMLQNLGVKLDPIKKVMVNSRLIKRLKANNIHSFKEYLDYSLSEAGKRSGELLLMIDQLTTHKTEFFREAEHFKFLENTILPKFDKGVFKIWSAGCSTGEEAYTMSMVLNEFKMKKPAFDYNLYASDVSQEVLIKAVRAIYREQDVVALPKNLIRKYFLRNKDSVKKDVRVVKAIRNKIDFFRLNLADDFHFQDNSLDVIFCRNTLIYFEDKAKRDVVNRFVEKIKTGGYLFVGLSETISLFSSKIKQVSPSVYIKISD